MIDLNSDPETPTLGSSELDVRRRVDVTRKATIYVILICLSWSVFFYWTGDTQGSVISVLLAFSYSVVLMVFRFGWNYLARVIWFVNAAGGAFISVVFSRPESDIDLLFLPLMGLAMLSFSWRFERKTAVFFVVMSMVLWGLLVLGGLMGQAEALFGIPINDSAPTHALALAMRLTVAFIIMIEIFFFVQITRTVEEQVIEARERAEASARSKGEFLANMSHEIRTPMNGVIGMVEVLEALHPTPEQKRSLDTIRSSAFALLRIIDDILDASKIDAGKLSLEPSITELRPLVEAVGETIRPTAAPLGVNVRLYIDPSLPEWALTDPGRFRQILLNLLSNAVKFSAKSLTGRTGDVFLRIVKEDKDHMLVTVQDRGIGMSESVRKRLFQPFMQGEASSTRRVGGTGLGLVITHNLVTLFGGEIKVQSTQSEGTEFNVRLPLIPADGPQRLLNISGANIVWFYDDSYAVTREIRTYFEKSGCTVVFVKDIAELLASGYVFTPDTVFFLATLDLKKQAALRNDLIKEWPEAKSIEVVEDRAGTIGPVGKTSYKLQVLPMRFSELHQAIRQLLDGGRPEASDDTPEKRLSLSPATGGKQVLVVEDNLTNQIVMRTQLEMLGHQVSIANDGLEGLDAWRRRAFHLILTDCHMPNMDGYEMVEIIRAEEAKGGRRRTPICAFTANLLGGEIESAQERGMDACLVKPISLDTLRAEIDRLVPEAVD